MTTRATNGEPAALVLVTSSYPIAADGSEAAGSFVADLAAELARWVPVRIVAPGRGGEAVETAAGAADANESAASAARGAGFPIEVYRFAAPPRALSSLKPWRAADAVQIARVLGGGLAATRRALAAGPSAHVLALWGLPCGWWARRAAAAAGVGYSVWMLGSDVWSLGRVPGVRGVLARVIRDAAHAYADGYALADEAARIAGAAVAFLPSTRAIDASAAAAPRSSPPYRLLFLGRWHPNKGVDLLLDALARLGDADWRRIEAVEIHGGGPLEPEVRAKVAALRAQARPVTPGGYLAKVDAEAAIARADWVLIPSRVESIPVVFSDAMKLGRPVVTMPVGDLPRMLDQHPCGVLATSVDADAFAAALRAALAASPAQFARGVAATAAEFDLATIARRILADGGLDG